MASLYHFRALERDGVRVRLRVWMTNPDVLAWGAKALPSRTRELASTPLFAALLLREQCDEADALRVAQQDAVAAYRSFRGREVASGRSARAEPTLEEEVLVGALAAEDSIDSLAVSEVLGFPPPKHAWDASSRAKYDAYWKAYQERDDGSDPPEHLARFDLAIVFKDPRWMSSRWPDGVRGTTAFAMESSFVEQLRIDGRDFLLASPSLSRAAGLYSFRVLEREPTRVRVRFWITSSEVLAWERQKVKHFPWRTAIPGVAPKLRGPSLKLAGSALEGFAAHFLFQRTAEADKLAVAVAEELEKRERARLRLKDPGEKPDASKAEVDAVHRVGQKQAIASVNALEVAGAPVPDHAHDGSTPALAAQYGEYWRGMQGWKGAEDPPGGLVRFDLEIVLKAKQWMPSRWPDGIAAALGGRGV